MILRRVIYEFLELGVSGFPWPAPNDGSVMAQVRANARKHFLMRYPIWIRPLAVLVMCLLWPIAIIMSVRWGIRACLGAVKWSAVPAELHAASPEMEPKRLTQSLFSTDMRGLYKWLNPHKVPQWVTDKLAFHDFAKLHQIPTPDCLVGSEIDDAAAAQGVVIKPKRGSGGRDLSLIVGQRVGTLEPHNVAQPFYAPTRSLKSKLNTSFPVHIRLVTGCKKNQEAYPIVAYFEINRGAEIVSEKTEFGTIDHQTGLGVNGIEIAELSSMSHSLAKIHTNHSKAVFLGWDILYNGADLTVLEANLTLSMPQIEYMLGAPLAQTAIAPILESYL